MIAAPTPTRTLQPERERRHAVLVQVCNLTDEGKELLNTVIAILTDPALERAREELLDGRMALQMDGGEVTWINPGEGVGS